MGCPLLLQGNLPNDPGLESTSPVSPAFQADSLSTEPSGKPLGIFIGAQKSVFVPREKRIPVTNMLSCPRRLGTSLINEGSWLPPGHAGLANRVPNPDGYCAAGRRERKEGAEVCVESEAHGSPVPDPHCPSVVGLDKQGWAGLLALAS